MKRAITNKALCTLAGLLAGFGLAMLVGRPAGSSAEDKSPDPHGGHAMARNAENWAPVDKMHLYLCAFHVAKNNPSFQIEAHHYCAPQGGELHQCAIYDSRGPNPKLLGTEYIIPDAMYRKLPADEKKYWHPHAYEILSGQLIAADLPNQGDEMFPGLITTWGKTWHTWPDPSTTVPMGEPLLMWSANGDGQIDQKLISKRDAQFGISTDAIRQRRKAYGFSVPRIPPPTSINDLGRQWTPNGADEPTKTKAKN